MLAELYLNYASCDTCIQNQSLRYQWKTSILNSMFKNTFKMKMYPWIPATAIREIQHVQVIISIKILM